MDKAFFKREAIRSMEMPGIDGRMEYWDGYCHGLLRQYHGRKYCTDEQHQTLMKADGDEAARKRSQGYRAGYVSEYCTQSEGDCRTCSLVNYGRDCRNEPLE